MKDTILILLGCCLGIILDHTLIANEESNLAKYKTYDIKNILKEYDKIQYEIKQLNRKYYETKRIYGQLK